MQKMTFGELKDMLLGDEPREDVALETSDKPQGYAWDSHRKEVDIDEFLRKLEDSELEVEDIINQNAEFYASEKNPWETFLNDMTDDGKKSVADAFGLDFHVDTGDIDDLPPEIAKYMDSTPTSGPGMYEANFDADEWLKDVFTNMMNTCSDVYESKKVVKEQVSDLGMDATYDDIQDELDNDTLEGFCEQLDFLAKSSDEKARVLFETFKQGWKDEFKNIRVKGPAFINIRELQPTQNVIFAKKSLKFILNGQWKMKQGGLAVDVLLGEEKPQVEMGDPLVVCKVGGTFYLIDGHHRWSKAYAFNPSCSMAAYLIEGSFRDADEVLKFAQGTLTALRATTPINDKQPDNDFNLYDITPQQLESIVDAYTTDDVLEHIMQAPITNGIVKDNGTLLSYLWGNVRIMRQYAPQGAHDREFMPQFPDGDANPKNALDAISENTKFALTIKQIKQIIKEASVNEMYFEVPDDGEEHLYEVFFDDELEQKGEPGVKIGPMIRKDAFVEIAKIADEIGEYPHSILEDDEFIMPDYNNWVDSINEGSDEHLYEVYWGEEESETESPSMVFKASGKMEAFRKVADEVSNRGMEPGGIIEDKFNDLTGEFFDFLDGVLDEEPQD